MRREEKRWEGKGREEIGREGKGREERKRRRKTVVGGEEKMEVYRNKKKEIAENQRDEGDNN